MRKLELKPDCERCREFTATLIVGNFVIKEIQKDMMKHNYLFAIDFSDYYRRKLRDLCNLIL